MFADNETGQTSQAAHEQTKGGDDVCSPTNNQIDHLPMSTLRFGEVAIAADPASPASVDVPGGAAAVISRKSTDNCGLM